jgi:hypothetical protein
MSMSTPPGMASQSSSITPSAPKPLTELTPGEAGVLGYTGETIWPLTRIEAIKHYNAYTSRQLTTLHELEDGSHCEGRKLILDVDGNRVPIERNAYDPSNARFLYRLLHPRMIAQVGNYYYCLRQRPSKKGSLIEYIPNKRYAYRDVKRTLAQIKISVLPSRMWDELPLAVLTDKMLHPYTE